MLKRKGNSERMKGTKMGSLSLQNDITKSQSHTFVIDAVLFIMRSTQRRHSLTRLNTDKNTCARYTRIDRNACQQSLNRIIVHLLLARLDTYLGMHSNASLPYVVAVTMNPVLSLPLLLLLLQTRIDAFPLHQPDQRIASAEQSTHHRHRQLQNTHCSFESLINGACELTDYCQGLGEGNYLTCHGNVTDNWTIQYEYDLSCDTTGQLCSKERGALHMLRDSLQRVQSYETFTAPVPGTIALEKQIRRCESEEPDFVFGEAFAFCEESCPSVSIGGIECSRSCAACADGSMAVDCSAVHASLTPQCSTDFYRNVFQYWASVSMQVCSYSALMEGECTLNQYCQSLPAEPASHIRCGGVVSSAWHVAVEYDEYCYHNFTDAVGQVMLNNEDRDTFRYCSTQQTIFRFIGNELVEIDATETFTHPAQGTIEQVYAVQPCDARPDYFLGPGNAYCEESCPVLSRIGNVVCDKECRTCPDGRQVIACSDIGIEESCESPLYASVLQYFDSSRPNNINNLVSEPASEMSSGALVHQVWMAFLSASLSILFVR